MSFNKITIVGNLGKDPELRYTPQGNAVCNFSVATNEKRRDKTGELQDATTWFRITLWGKQAENASKYLTKGSPIYIEGRLRVEQWSDRDGKERFTLDVNATDMQFIGSGNNRSEGGSSIGESSFDEPDFGSTPTPSDDDIPF
ncbi:MAG TPA: single-stranded DNA-binding protein [Pyrinomonadaceae bacterium]|nr:single-stranded DNA-binding protein [Pyrinomonadaceae bacterium]